MSADTTAEPGLYPCVRCPLHFSYPQDLGRHYADEHTPDA